MNNKEERFMDWINENFIHIDKVICEDCGKTYSEAGAFFHADGFEWCDECIRDKYEEEIEEEFDLQ